MTNHDLYLKAKVNGNDPNTSGVAVSSTSTYYSKLVSGSHATSKAYHFSWTGTPVGTLTMWESDKESPILTTDADWKQYTDAPITNPAGAAASFRMEVNGRSARWTRFKYVNASSSGVLFGRATSQGS